MYLTRECIWCPTCLLLCMLLESIVKTFYYVITFNERRLVPAWANPYWNLLIWSSQQNLILLCSTLGLWSNLFLECAFRCQTWSVHNRDMTYVFRGMLSERFPEIAVPVSHYFCDSLIGVRITMLPLYSFWYLEVCRLSVFNF